MRHLILLIAIVFFAPSAHPKDQEGGTFVKEARLSLASDEDARNWSFGMLSLDEWIQVMSKPEWEILQKSESEEFFVGIWRTANHLIFHQYPKPGKEYGYTIKIEGNPGGDLGRRQENVSIKYRITSVNEYRIHHDTFFAMQIEKGYSGTITLSCTTKSNGAVAKYTIPWNGKAEPVAAGQPATRSESK